MLSTSYLGQLLNETSLDEALLNETLLIEALLPEASLVQALLNETMLIEALLTETSLIKTSLTKTSLDEASRKETLLIEALLIEALLIEASLDEAVLNETLLIEALLTETLLTDALLTDASLDEALLDETLLIETLLAETVLTDRLESFNGRTVRTDSELAGREPLRLVERESVSVPRTTRLGGLLDVFRSNCISPVRNALAGHENEEGNPEAGEHTVTTKLTGKVQIIGHFYINGTQKALISSLELALIEYLNCDDGRVLHRTGCW
jgi:hypothetical protein